MRSPRSLVLLLTCALPAQHAPQAGALGDGTVAVVCHRSDDLTVQLRHKASADAADPDWLAFEFVNHTRAPITLAHVSFHLDDRKVHELGTGALVCSGSLTQGGLADLFGKPGPIALPPGATRVLRQVCERTTAMLGSPSPGGWRIEARVAVAIARLDEPLLAPTLPGAAFAFEWHRPDDAGVARLRAQLEQLLRLQDPSPSTGPLVAMLLATPGVGDRVPLERLLAAQPAVRKLLSPWPAVLRHLDTHHKNDPGLLAWAQQRLAGADGYIVEDLMAMLGVWQPSFLPDLVRRHEAGDQRVLWALEWRGGPHAGDPEATQRLSRRFAAQLPAQLPKPESVDYREHERIAHVLRSIGMARDQRCIDALAPWLDCRLPLWAQKPMQFEPRHGAYHRICDAALDALLRIGGEETRRTVDTQVPLGLNESISIQFDLAALDQHQDQKIAALQRYFVRRQLTK